MATLLRRMLGSQPGETLADQLDALLRTFALSEALPLFASLLDLPPAAQTPSSMPPERQREETLEALVALVLAMTEVEPVILLVEDLHWLDATTLTWLERLIDQAATAPLLLVMTIRPNTLDIPWGSRARVVQIALGALSSQDTEQLIELLSGDTKLTDRVQQHIVAKTDGVPLFVEELTRSMLEGGESGDWRELPTTLRDSLTARLSRLGTAKEVAQLASVIGRAFSLRLLAAIAAHPVDTLERELRKLVQSGLVHRRGFGVQTRYSFKHALVRDAAYDSLLRRERQQIHLRIAAAMEDGRHAGDAALSEEIAHHYFAGEQYAKAFEGWLEAGQLAMGRSAHAEAIAHLQHGLDALNATPASPDRDRLEIGLRSLLSMSLGVIRGLSAPDVEAVHERMLILTGQLGDDVPLGIYFGLWNFYASRGRLHRARDLAQQRLALGEATGDDASRLVGLYTLAAADAFLGNLAEARDGFERLLAGYPKEGLSNPALAYDIGAVGPVAARRLAVAARPARGSDAHGGRGDRAGAPLLAVHAVGRARQPHDPGHVDARRRHQPAAGAGADRAQLRALLPVLGRALAHLAGADRHLRGIGRRRDRSRAAGGRVGDRADADRLRQQPAEQPLPRLDGVGVSRSWPPRAGAAPPRRGRGGHRRRGRALLGVRAAPPAGAAPARGRRAGRPDRAGPRRRPRRRPDPGREDVRAARPRRSGLKTHLRPSTSNSTDSQLAKKFSAAPTTTPPHSSPPPRPAAAPSA